MFEQNLHDTEITGKGRARLKETGTSPDQHTIQTQRCNQTHKHTQINRILIMTIPRTTALWSVQVTRYFCATTFVYVKLCQQDKQARYSVSFRPLIQAKKNTDFTKSQTATVHTFVL